MTGMLRFQFLPVSLVGNLEPDLVTMVLNEWSHDGLAIRSHCRDSGESTGLVVTSRDSPEMLARRLGPLVDLAGFSNREGLIAAISAAPCVHFEQIGVAIRAHVSRLANTFHLSRDEAELLPSAAFTEVFRSLANFNPAKAGLRTFVESCLRMWSLGMRRKLGRKIDREKKFKASTKPADGCIVRTLCVSDSAFRRIEDSEFLQRWLEGLMAEDCDLLFERHRKSAVMIAAETEHHPATVRKRLGGLRDSYASFLMGDS